MRSSLALAAALCALTLVPARIHAQTAPAKPAAPATPAAAPDPAASPAAVPTFDATDLEKLRAHVKEVVEVRGTPTATGHSKSGNVFYLNFGSRRSAVAVVLFAPSGAAASAEADPAAPKALQNEDDLKAYVGKTVVVRGKVDDYKGDLQIVVKTADQIKVVDTPAPAPATAATPSSN